MGTSNFLVTHVLQNIFFCVQQKKEIHTGLEQLKCEEMMAIFDSNACIFYRNQIP